MEAYLFLIGAIIVILGVCVFFCDFEGVLPGIVIAVVGILVFKAGLGIGDLKEQLHDSQQHALSIEKGYKVELRAVSKDLVEAQSKVRQLTAANELLELQQFDCVSKQKLSQDTLSDIKEILEN